MVFRKSVDKGALPRTESPASINEKSRAPNATTRSNTSSSDEGQQSMNDEKNLKKLDSQIVKVKDGDQDPFGHLPQDEAEILRRQVFVPTIKVSPRTLYRYATRNDLLIVFVSCICAIAGGAAQPLMTVSFYPCNHPKLKPNSIAGHFRSPIRTIPAILRRRSRSKRFPRSIVTQCLVFCVPRHWRICHDIHFDYWFHLYWRTHKWKDQRALLGRLFATEHRIL